MPRCYLFFIMLLGLYMCAQTHTSGSYQRTYQDTVKHDTLSIDTVFITRKTLAPLDKYELKKLEHKEIYLWGDNKNMVTLPTSGGLAVNLNKLYNHLSNRGKGSRRLQRLFDREYQEDLVTEIWDPLLKEHAQLQGDTLKYFAIHARPSYAWITSATHYEQVAYLLERQRAYLDSLNLLMEQYGFPDR